MWLEMFDDIMQEYASKSGFLPASAQVYIHHNHILYQFTAACRTLPKGIIYQYKYIFQITQRDRTCPSLGFITQSFSVKLTDSNRSYLCKKPYSNLQSYVFTKLRPSDTIGNIIINLLQLVSVDVFVFNGISGFPLVATATGCARAAVAM